MKSQWSVRPPTSDPRLQNGPRQNRLRGTPSRLKWAWLKMKGWRSWGILNEKHSSSLIWPHICIIYIYNYIYIYTWFISLSYLSYNPELSQCVKDIICLLHHRKPKRHQGAKPWYPLLSWWKHPSWYSWMFIVPSTGSIGSKLCVI